MNNPARTQSCHSQTRRAPQISYFISHKNAVDTPALSLTSSASQWCFSQTLQHLKSTKRIPVSNHVNLKGKAECTLPSSHTEVDGVWRKILLGHCCWLQSSRAAVPAPWGGIAEEHIHRYVLPGLYLQMLTLVMHSSANKKKKKTNHNTNLEFLNFQSTLLDH